MLKTVRVCPSCGEQNGKFASFWIPTCGVNLGEIPQTVMDDEPPPSGAGAQEEVPRAKTPGSGAGPATEVASGDKGLLEVLELPGRVIRVCGAGVLGRGAENDLVDVPRSNLISRRHAQVIVEGGGAWIVDLGSTAGTMVDGRRCRPQEKVQLREGSVVTLAETSFTFRASR